MANELKNALDQLRTDVAAVTGVQRAMLGQPMDALSEATSDKCVAAVYMMAGSPDNAELISTTERHRVEIALYWLLQPINVEAVEQNMATMWDRLMTKFFGDDADRNLTEKATLGLISGEEGVDPYRAEYAEVGGKIHRVLTVPFEIILDTHSV